MSNEHQTRESIDFKIVVLLLSRVDLKLESILRIWAAVVNYEIFKPLNI